MICRDLRLFAHLVLVVGAWRRNARAILALGLPASKFVADKFVDLPKRGFSTEMVQITRS